MIEILSALLTPTIAAVAIVIAFMQWRTAHQKVVLDLFDRRLAIFDGVIKAVEVYFADTDDRSEAVSRLFILGLRSRFLFGQEVVDAIEGVRADIFRHSDYGRKMRDQNLSESARSKMREDWSEVSARLVGIHERFTAVCSPYLRMDQKGVPTPAEWLRDRNRLRLSYADEHPR